MILLTLITMLAGLAVMALTLKWGGNPFKISEECKKSNQWPLEKMKPYIKWNMVYINPNDPRRWVPKTLGYGWTMNFKTNEKAIIYMSLVAICIISAIVSAIIGTTL